MRLLAFYCVVTAVPGLVVGAFTGPPVLIASLAHAFLATLFISLSIGIKRRSGFTRSIAVYLSILLLTVGLAFTGVLVFFAVALKEPSRLPMIVVLALASIAQGYVFVNLIRPDATEWFR